MNYIDRLAHAIAVEAGEPYTDESDAYAPLWRSYAVLALTTGTETTSRAVHDCWSAWAAGAFAEHRSLVPFEQLTVEVQALDDKYRDAIRAVAARGVE